MNLTKDDKYYSELYKKEIKKIETRIAKIFKNKEPKTLYKPGEYIMGSGGKRIRPFLVLTASRATSNNKISAYNAALAVELLHNFTLAHDDIMDNSDLRRGRKTVHIKYDLSTAILTGDGLIALAYKYLTKDIKENSLATINSFTNGLVEVCEGQALDTDFEKRKNVSLEEYKTMIYKKTAALLETCCSIGALIGGGDSSQVNAMKRFGKNLGMAFQIQDDLLDITADVKKLGKPIGGDLREGKKTFLFLTALSIAKGEDKKMLKRVISNNGVENDEIDSYYQLYKKLGVIEIASKEVNKYSKLALKSLKSIPDSEPKEMLIWLTDSLIERKK